MVHTGLLGAITKVTVGMNGSPTGGPFPVAQVPKEVDRETWLGQAPRVDDRNQRYHPEFRWRYEYSGGKFTDWLAHHVDIAQWVLKEDAKGKGPVKIVGTDAKHRCPSTAAIPSETTRSSPPTTSRSRTPSPGASR